MTSKDEKTSDPAAAVLRAVDKRVETVEHGPFEESVNTWADLTEAIEAWRAAGRPGVGEVQYESTLDGTEYCEMCGTPRDYLERSAPTPPAAEVGEVMDAAVAHLEHIKATCNLEGCTCSLCEHIHTEIVTTYQKGYQDGRCDFPPGEPPPSPPAAVDKKHTICFRCGGTDPECCPTPPAAERGEDAIVKRWYEQCVMIEARAKSAEARVVTLQAALEDSENRVQRLLAKLDKPPTASDLLAVVELKQWLRREMGLARCEHVEGGKVRREIYMALFGKLDTLHPQRVRVVEGVVNDSGVGRSTVAINEELPLRTPVKVLIEEGEDTK